MHDLIMNEISERYDLNNRLVEMDHIQLTTLLSYQKRKKKKTKQNYINVELYQHRLVGVTKSPPSRF